MRDGEEQKGPEAENVLSGTGCEPSMRQPEENRYQGDR